MISCRLWICSACLLLASSPVLALAAVNASHRRATDASYSNAAIASTALRYVGQWGGHACADAQRSGETASTTNYPDYPEGFNASNPPTAGTKINPANGGDGQCRSFVDCVLWMASGKTQWVGFDSSDYFYAFTHPEGGGPPGVEIVNPANLIEGDIVQQGQTENDPNLHTYIIVTPLGGNQFEVVDSNYSHDEFVQEHTISVTTLGGNSRAFRMGTPPQPLQVVYDADINQDGHVDVVDLSILLRWYGDHPQAPQSRSAFRSDINGDGVVDVTDLSILLSHWGRSS